MNNSLPEKYNISVESIAHQYVTDYTSKKMIKLSKAFLVLGSDLKGPMGYDLVPFAIKEEAQNLSPNRMASGSCSCMKPRWSKRKSIGLPRAQKEVIRLP